MAVARSDTGRPLWRSTLVLVSLAGVAASLTLLFLGMRSVMDVGGVCAEGGAFEIRQRCPEGVPAIFVGAIWGGLVALGVCMWQAIKHDITNLVALAWPALFLSLSWNFFAYGFDPPGDPGVSWPWLLCGIVMVVIGGSPMAVVVPAWRRSTRELSRKGKLDPLRALDGASAGVWTTVQVVAIAIGIAGAVALFEVAT